MSFFLDSRLTGGGKAVSFTRLPHFTRKKDTWCSCLLGAIHGAHVCWGLYMVFMSAGGWVDSRTIKWLKGLGKLKNGMTSLEFEPGTLRLIAERLNQLWRGNEHILLSLHHEIPEGQVYGFYAWSRNTAKYRRFHEEWRLLGCYAVWLLYEPTYRKNVPLPSSGWQESAS
jgi:hypothetical protein